MNRIKAISKRAFLKATGAVALGAALWAGGALLAVKDLRAAVFNVDGQNNPAVDVSAIQSAINAAYPGDTIRVHGTFNFGANGRVTVNKELALVGDVVMKGNKVTQWLTTIYGGGPAPTSEFNEGGVILNAYNSGKLTIEGINFEEAMESVVGSYYSAGLDVRRCRIVGVKAYVDPVNYYNDKTPIWVWLGTGKQVFKENIIDVSKYQGMYSRAITVVLGEAETEIIDNDLKVTNTFNMVGFEVFSSGSCTAERNHIIAGRIAMAAFTYGTVNLNHNYGELVPDNNDNPSAAIWVASDLGGNISNNDFRLTEGIGGGIHLSFPFLEQYGVDIGFTNGVIKNNRFTGTVIGSGAGILLDAGTSLCQFEGNNLVHLVYPDGTPALTYVILPSGSLPVSSLPAPSNNTIKGYTGGSDRVLDLGGTNNYLTGVTPMKGAGGVGSKFLNKQLPMPQSPRRRGL